MNTNITLKETHRRIDIKIQIDCSVFDVLCLERLLDRFLDEIENRDSCHILLGIESALERLNLKPERLVADDGKEHYFVPKLHRPLETLRCKTPYRILHMIGPLSEVRKKENSK